MEPEQYISVGFRTEIGEIMFGETLNHFGHYTIAGAASSYSKVPRQCRNQTEPETSRKPDKSAIIVSS